MGSRINVCDANKGVGLVKTIKLGMMAVCMVAGVFLAGPAAVAAPLELTLDNAVKMALESNPSGKIAVYDFEAAKGALTSARSYRWPTISGSHNDMKSWAGEQANRSAGRDPAYTVERYTNSLSLNWTLWSGNRVESQVSQAKLQVDSSRWGVELARQQLKFNATNAYYLLMGARDLVKLDEEAVGRLEQYLRDVSLQYEVGVVAKVDVLRSEVSLAQARQDLIEARNAHDLAMANLNNIISQPLTTELLIQGDLGSSIYAETLSKCMDNALRQRPEISQFSDAVKAAQEAITIARAGYLPTVSASFQTGWYDNTFVGGENNNWTASLSTNWTFLDSGLTAGRLKQATEGYHKAQEQLKQNVDSVQLDVQATYLSLKSSEQSIETSRAAVGLAEEDFKIKVIRYQAGVGTNLDVLDSQFALTTAKNNYLKALYGNNTFRAKLDKAMGNPVN